MNGKTKMTGQQLLVGNVALKFPFLTDHHLNSNSNEGWLFKLKISAVSTSKTTTIQYHQLAGHLWKYGSIELLFISLPEKVDVDWTTLYEDAKAANLYHGFFPISSVMIP